MADPFSSVVEPNVPGLDQSIAAGQRVATRTSKFFATASAGAIIAAIVDPFGSGSTFSTVGTVPAQLALSDGNIVKGAGAAVAGTEYKIRVLASGADGQRETSSILSFTAVSPPQVTANMVDFFGPSHAAQIEPGALSGSADSTLTYRRNARWAGNMWAARNGRRAAVQAAGIGGALIAAYLPAWTYIAARKARVVLFWANLINDLNQDVPANTGTSTGAYAQTYWDLLRPKAEEVVAWGGTPIFARDWLGTGAGQAQKIAESNIFYAFVDAWATARGLPTTLDTRSVVWADNGSSGTITFKAGYANDGLHMWERGGYYLSKLLDAALNPRFDAAPAYVGPTAQTATQALANPNFSGGTASPNAPVTGVIPASWSLDSSGTVTAGSASLAAGPNGQVLTINFTPGSLGANLRLRQDVTTALTTALASSSSGIKVRMRGKASIATPANLQSFTALLTGTVAGAAGTTVVSDLEPTSSPYLPGTDEAYSATLETPWSALIAPGTSLASMSARYLLYGGAASGAGVATISETALEILIL